MTDTIRVMIADDHPMFRHGLRMLLTSTPGFDVIGEAADGASVVPLARQLQPDVVLMDIQMPGLNGIEATIEIMRHCPNIAILMVTMYGNDESVFAAMRAGARGYLGKGAEPEEIVRAIQTVKNGGAVFSPAIAARMMAYFSDVKPAQSADPFPELTEREVEVLDLIAQGMNNGEIAERLVLAAHTVRNHVSNIFGKLDVADRTRAVIIAREKGLGHGE